MLFRYFTPHIPPHSLAFVTDGFPDLDRSHARVEDVVSHHSEIPRLEYNYVFNTDGIRTIEFNEKPNIITIGCSVTLGVGLPTQLTWPVILEKNINKFGNYKVGNLSYNGASPMKNISAFFGLINKYEYLPEYVICNFANFERAWFWKDNKYIHDIFWSEKGFKFKDSYPYNYENILPIEWIYFSNLDHIKMLETFCKMNGIKLIWSTWSNNIKNEYEDFVKKAFPSYISDTTRDVFPNGLESNGWYKDDMNEILSGFKMNNWETIRCHEEHYDGNPYPFHYAYDYHHNKPEISNRLPHSGHHRHLHWADFYLKELIKK